MLLLFTGTSASHGASKLPSDFQWGVSNSALQVEGNTPPSNWDVYAEKGKIRSKAGVAADFWRQYPQDIQLAKELGSNVFRYSVSWSRLQPADGVWDEQAFRVYDDMLAKVKAAGMKPVITLYHWEYPKWMMKGSEVSLLNSSEFVDRFAVFMRKVVDRYKGQGVTWITINEPESIALNEFRYAWGNPFAIRDQITKAHGAAYDYIKQVDPAAKVSASTSWYGYRFGNTAIPIDFFIKPLLNKLDFVALQYYWETNFLKPVEAVKLFFATILGHYWDSDIEPTGIQYALDYYAKAAPGKQIVITENGMPTEDGKVRPDGYKRCEQLADTVHQLQLARDRGIPVVGYYYWSLTDNWEWGSTKPRFGLYSLDSAQTRIPTDGVPTYKALVQQNGVSADYRPRKTESGFAGAGQFSACPQTVAATRATTAKRAKAYKAKRSLTKRKFKKLR